MIKTDVVRAALETENFVHLENAASYPTLRAAASGCGNSVAC